MKAVKKRSGDGGEIIFSLHHAHCIRLNELPPAGRPQAALLATRRRRSAVAVAVAQKEKQE